ncbi:hypothetical protein NL390_32570, partial [Klebsiella pneumoniae]|nr:hypothetical protein [Klebsiella pneumoniae]
GVGFPIFRPGSPVNRRQARAGFEFVARTDAQHRLREIQRLYVLLPGAALDAPCPGYRLSDGCELAAPSPERSYDTGTFCAR